LTADHVQENRRYWNAQAHLWVTRGEAAWASRAPYWGIWETPETALNLLPESLSGARAVELGCGTGYVSRWMEVRGATVVGVDVSRDQLQTACRLAREYQSSVEFLLGNAELAPLPNQCADFVISEYGAAIWCDPYVWIPEASRLLRVGGQLVFLGNHPLAMLSIGEEGDLVTHHLNRSYFGLHRLDWTKLEVDPGGVEFNLPFSQWLRLFKTNGFRLDEYHEIRAPVDQGPAQFGVPWDWARDYPAEQAFVLTKV